MEGAIREADWKRFRELRPLALDRFCQRVLTELGQLATAKSPGSHERYLAVYHLVPRRDEELAKAFNEPRRSTAVLQLACLQAQGLLTEEEFADFSPECRAAVGAYLGLGLAEPGASPGSARRGPGPEQEVS